VSKASPKKTKEETNYRTGNSRRRCGICTMFVKPDGCTAVSGIIRPFGDCDLYERDREKVLENKPI
jgi:hypothetical protein